MLYDPKWDKLSLESLIAWLEKQPADASYNYQDSRQCMGAQFLRQAGVQENGYVGRCGLAMDDLVPGLYYIAAGEYEKEEWTFGAALKRARATASS